MATVREGRAEAVVVRRGEIHSADPGDPVEFDGFTLLPSRGGVEIEGLDLEDAKMALRLLGAAKEVQYELGARSAAQLINVMSAAGVDLTPPASVEQARRLADHRRKLLSTPTHTIPTLGELQRKKSASATRTWVSRKRDNRQLFTVTVDGHVLIPAFQLNDDGSPRRELAPIMKTLVDAGVDGWSLWTWLTEGTPLLSGGVPEQLAATDPERVMRAAARYAAQNRPAN